MKCKDRDGKRFSKKKRAPKKRSPDRFASREGRGVVLRRFEGKGWASLGPSRYAVCSATSFAAASFARFSYSAFSARFVVTDAVMPAAMMRDMPASAVAVTVSSKRK